MALRKEDKADLRKRYPLYVELGMVLALGLLIIAFKASWAAPEPEQLVMEEQEIVEMEEIQQTKQEVKPPPPPRPPVPVEVPNDEILEDEALDLDASLDIDEPLTNLPPPPPPADDEEEEDAEPEVFVIVEDPPELIGGIEGLQAKVKYPEIARKAGVEGMVVVQFIVDEQGNVLNPVVLRGPGAGLDEEAVRVVAGARFQPGKQRGKPVRVKMSLPIRFKLR